MAKGFVALDMRALWLILILSSMPLSAMAQNPPDSSKLEALSAEQKAAEAKKAKLEAERKAAKAEIERLRRGLIDAAAQAQSYEKAARSATRKMDDLSKQKADLMKALIRDREEMGNWLGLLQRLERTPPPSIAVQPKDALKAAQAASLMATVTKELGARADSVESQLSEIQLVETKITKEHAQLTQAERDLAARRKTIDGQVEEKTKLEASIREQSEAQDKIIKRLVSEANDLKSLVETFEARARASKRRRSADSTTLRGQDGGIPTPRRKPRADRPAAPFIMPPETNRFADARGQLRAPVQGRITTKYRARMADGTRAQGLTVKTSARGQVVSPYTGRIAFVGPFKEYENVYMLDVGEGYFIVLTGLAKTHGREGDVVQSGEPIGAMPAGRAPALYIELWKNGSPVDPTPWLGTVFARG